MCMCVVCYVGMSVVVRLIVIEYVVCSMIVLVDILNIGKMLLVVCLNRFVVGGVVRMLSLLLVIVIMIDLLNMINVRNLGLKLSVFSVVYLVVCLWVFIVIVLVIMVMMIRIIMYDIRWIVVMIWFDIVMKLS